VTPAGHRCCGRSREQGWASDQVSIVDSEQGTAAANRVLIDLSSGCQVWTTVGASTNIIAASWRELADSLEYALLVNNREIGSSLLADATGQDVRMLTRVNAACIIARHESQHQTFVDSLAPGCFRADCCRCVYALLPCGPRAY
jgi:hypothetical protein